MELCFDNISKHFGKIVALDNISINLTEGIYGLLGPNGAGKSTLMNILTGNVLPTTGKVTFNGQESRTMGAAFRQKIGYMPQQQVYYPGFSVEQFLFYIASLRGMKRNFAISKIDWVLEAVELKNVQKKEIKTLSGGMKQRLMLAQAILDSPDILILDEPTAGLDPRQRIAIRNLVGEISLHKIVIISTHIVSDIEYISKELILLEKGRVLKQDSPEALIQKMYGQIWEITVPEEQIQAVAKHGLVCGIVKRNKFVLIRLLSEKRPPFPCKCIAPNLEDVYLNYFGEGDVL